MINSFQSKVGSTYRCNHQPVNPYLAKGSEPISCDPLCGVELNHFTALRLSTRPLRIGSACPKTKNDVPGTSLLKRVATSEREAFVSDKRLVIGIPVFTVQKVLKQFHLTGSYDATLFQTGFLTQRMN